MNKNHILKSKNELLFLNGKLINSIYNEYLLYRPSVAIPFSWESVISYLFMCFVSDQLSQESNLLELGVENGGSALLTLLTLKSHEKFYLVDLRKTEIFESSFAKLPQNLREKVQFVIDKTTGSKTEILLSLKYRWIHIDAGHLYQQVLDDLIRFEGLLNDDGILVMDDFFQGRWPGVTEAIYEYFRDYSPNLKAVLIAHNKIYFCRSFYHEYIMNYIKNFGDTYFNFWGNMRLIETSFKGSSCLFLSGNLFGNKRGITLE